MVAYLRYLGERLVILVVTVFISITVVFFVPRLVVIMLVALVTLPWGLEMLVDYSSELFRNIPSSL